jgi:hypothetical protein
VKQVLTPRLPGPRPGAGDHHADEDRHAEDRQRRQAHALGHKFETVFAKWLLLYDNQQAERLEYENAVIRETGLTMDEAERKYIKQHPCGPTDEQRDRDREDGDRERLSKKLWRLSAKILQQTPTSLAELSIWARAISFRECQIWDKISPSYENEDLRALLEAICSVAGAPSPMTPPRL